MSHGTAIVIGLARSGMALARTLHADGYHVVVVDRDDGERVRARAAELPPGIEVRLGEYPDDVALDAAVVAPSPGVAWDAPELNAARRAGVPVRSEIDLVFERCRGRVIGITGTNGKTTTTSLVAAILSRGPVPVHLGGNIGMPMLDRLGGVEKDDWVVLELSSYQIETVAEPRCAIACVLNVTPDHLERHGSFTAYAEIKSRIIRHATGHAVLGYDDAVTREMARLASCPVRYFGLTLADGDGTTVRDGVVVSNEGAASLPVLPVTDIPLLGEHNVLNVLAAVAITRAAGAVAADIAGAVRDFHGVTHRLERVREEGGVLWINDSKATNAVSAVVALRAFAHRPVVWIGGGKRGAGVPDELVDAVVSGASHAVLMGESGPELDAALGARGFEARTLVPDVAAAVRAAGEIAAPGDVVLFAPGFKSFDQFRDFEHRGEVFSDLVRAGTQD